MSKRERSTFDVLKRIDDERIKRNWTEYMLAKNADLPQSTISTWYRKQLQPSVASIEKICNGLGISLAQFFSEESYEQSLTANQQEMIALWEKLNPEQKEAVNRMLRTFVFI